MLADCMTPFRHWLNVSKTIWYSNNMLICRDFTVVVLSSWIVVAELSELDLRGKIGRCNVKVKVKYIRKLATKTLTT